MAEVRAFFPDLIGVDQMKRRNALLESGDARADAQLGLDYRRQQVAENALMQRQNEGMDTARREAIGQLGAMAQAAQRSGNPRAFVMSVVRNPQYRPIFQAAGVDPAQLDLNSPTFDDDLGTWAALGPQVSPDARFNRETAAQGRESTQQFQTKQSALDHQRRLAEIEAGKAQQAGYRMLTPVEVSQAGLPRGTSAQASPQGKVEVLNKPETKSSGNEVALATYEQGMAGLSKAMSNTATGPVLGVLPAFTSEQQIAEGAVAAMAPILKSIFRVAGEGTFTDRDQALLLDMVPTRRDSPQARKAKIQNIDNIVRAKLGAATQSAGASGSWSVEELR